MPADCIFCSIAAKKIPADIVKETDQIVAFNDISPQAPCHILIIPKKHIHNINDIKMADADLICTMVQAAKELALTINVADPGYRLVINCNKDGGQTVDHLHLHMLAGRQMNWPPG